MCVASHRADVRPGPRMQLESTPCSGVASEALTSNRPWRSLCQGQSVRIRVPARLRKAPLVQIRCDAKVGYASAAPLKSQDAWPVSQGRAEKIVPGIHGLVVVKGLTGETVEAAER